MFLSSMYFAFSGHVRRYACELKTGITFYAKFTNVIFITFIFTARSELRKVLFLRRQTVVSFLVSFHLFVRS